MAILRFGNVAPVEVQRNPDDTETRTPLDGPCITSVGLPDDQDAEGNVFPLWSVEEALTTLTHPVRGIVRMHSDASPAWVDCPEWPELEARVAGFYAAERGLQLGFGIDEEITGEAPAPVEEPQP
jgi:hypothetical protein